MNIIVRKYDFEVHTDYEIIDFDTICDNGTRRRIAKVTEYKKCGTVYGWVDMENGQQREIKSAKAYLEMCLAEHPVEEGETNARLV